MEWQWLPGSTQLSFKLLKLNENSGNIEIDANLIHAARANKRGGCRVAQGSRRTCRRRDVAGWRKQKDRLIKVPLPGLLRQEDCYLPLNFHAINPGQLGAVSYSNSLASDRRRGCPSRPAPMRNSRGAASENGFLVAKVLCGSGIWRIH